MADVILDGADVFAESVVGGFAGLGHEIGDVDAGSAGASDGVGNFGDEEIGNEAGVERARAKEDEIGLVNGFDGSRERLDAARGKFETTDGGRGVRDIGFALDAAAIGEGGDEMHVGDGGRKDAAANGEDFAGNANGLGEISGDVGEGGEEEIAEVVPAEAASGLEAILKELAEERFVFRKGDHAVANVARRKDAIFAAEAAGAAAVIGDGDDGGKIADGAPGGGPLVGATDDMFLEAAEEGGEASAAAEGDDAKALLAEDADWDGRAHRGFRIETGSNGTERAKRRKPVRSHKQNERIRANWRTAEESSDPGRAKFEKRRDSAGVAFFLGIEELGEARVLLEEGKVFVVAGVEAIGGAKVNGDLEIGHGGIGLTGEAIESGESVVDVIGLGGEFAGPVEAFAGFIPAAKVHHGDAALVMVFGGLGILIHGRLEALFDDAEMHAGAIGELTAGTGKDLFELLLGALELLLMEEGHGLFVEFHLGLDVRINHFDTAALGRQRLYPLGFLRLRRGMSRGGLSPTGRGLLRFRHGANASRGGSWRQRKGEGRWKTRKCRVG